ncbi:MAG: hypothetical protein Q4C54_02440 [Clostridia bacterium]|nr:hypothetical protein [Clostridia bacterium]
MEHKPGTDKKPGTDLMDRLVRRYRRRKGTMRPHKRRMHLLLRAVQAVLGAVMVICLVSLIQYGVDYVSIRSQQAELQTIYTETEAPAAEPTPQPPAVVTA